MQSIARADSDPARQIVVRSAG